MTDPLWLVYNGRIHLSPGSNGADVAAVLRAVPIKDLIAEMGRRGKVVCDWGPYKAMLAELQDKPILHKLYEDAE